MATRARGRRPGGSKQRGGWIVRKADNRPDRVAWLVVAGLVAFMLLLAGCGSDDDGGGTAQEVQKVGKGEGSLNLIAWAGYVEDGTTTKGIDWVTPFEKQTGCQTSVK